MNKKTCVLCGNFISIYKINRTLHGRLGIRILSSRAESISHEWEILSPLEDKIRIPKRPCNILYLLLISASILFRRYSFELFLIQAVQFNSGVLVRSTFRAKKVVLFAEFAEVIFCKLHWVGKYAFNN